jgi:hypothetical protein
MANEPGWYEEAKPHKLPLWATIGQAYGAVASNFGRLLLASWPWLLALAGLTYLSTHLGAAYQMEAIAAVKTQRPMPDQPIELVAVNSANAILYIVASLSMAVGMHRFLLLGEPMRLGDNIVTGPTLRYLAVGLLMGLVMFLPMLAAIGSVWALSPPPSIGVAGTPVPAAPPGALALLVVPAVFWAAMLGTRLTMALPARAVGHNGINFRAIWKQTSGNTWRIGFGFLLCVLPIALVTQALVTGTLMARMPDPKDSEAVVAWISSMAIPNGMMVAILTLSNMVGIAFLSLAYRHFFGSRPDEQLQVRRG